MYAVPHLPPAQLRRAAIISAAAGVIAGQAGLIIGIAYDIRGSLWLNTDLYLPVVAIIATAMMLGLFRLISGRKLAAPSYALCAVLPGIYSFLAPIWGWFVMLLVSPFTPSLQSHRFEIATDFRGWPCAVVIGAWALYRIHRPGASAGPAEKEP